MLPAAVCKKLPGSGGKVMTHWPCRRSPGVGRMGRRMGDRRAPGPRVVATRHLAGLARPRAGAPCLFQILSCARTHGYSSGRLLRHSTTLTVCYSVTGFSNRQFPLGVLAGDDDGRTGRVARARNAHRLSAGRPERLNARRPRLPVRAFPLAETWSGSV